MKKKQSYLFLQINSSYIYIRAVNRFFLIAINRMIAVS